MAGNKELLRNNLIIFDVVWKKSYSSILHENHSL